MIANLLFQFYRMDAESKGPRKLIN